MSQETIAVNDELGNAIIIRAKLNFGQMSRVRGAGLKFRIDPETNETEVEMNMAAFQQQMLVESCVSWHGSKFAGVVFSKDALLGLDSDDPLLQKVLTEVSARNNKKDDAPKALSPNGSASSTVIEATASQ
jgi:hypothetical protein